MAPDTVADSAWIVNGVAAKNVRASRDSNIFGTDTPPVRPQTFLTRRHTTQPPLRGVHRAGIERRRALPQPGRPAPAALGSAAHKKGGVDLSAFHATQG